MVNFQSKHFESAVVFFFLPLIDVYMERNKRYALILSDFNIEENVKQS